MNDNIIIGIDPDVDKSGFAVWLPSEQIFDEINALTLGEIINYINLNRGRINLVVIEAGWLNKGNRHINEKTTPRIAAKTGENVGRNFQRGIDLAEIMEFFKIPCRLVKPTATNSWKTDEKMFQKITGTKGGNPEKRDAAMLVFGLK